MNPHALSVLQFASVLDVVAGHAATSLGAEVVRALRPLGDLADAEQALTRVTAMRALVSSDAGWSPQGFADVRAALARLRVPGTQLTGPELRDVAQLARASRLTAESLRDPRQPLVARTVLDALRQRLPAHPRHEAAVDRAIDDDGTVRDDASPLLRRVRRELRHAQGDLVALLERIVSRLEPHQRVLDASVTLRNGRFVIPIRREARGAVGGLVHDASGSGATLFVEPPAAIEACNRIRELEGEEAREVDRILMALSDELRPSATELRDALDALVELDGLYARARYAIRFRCEATRLRRAGEGFAVRDGRHPLLLAQGIEVVPFDLTMEPGERTLLVSGPNTGGKTVLLKALALFSAMLQSGIPVPAAGASEVAAYDDVFADIGDEQSIEASLSTFSAHLKNLGEILRSSTARSLVVIDELGSGTDPAEGAALGGAILEALTTRGAMTVATTHLGALKELATEVPGIVNASLEFDAVALGPTYRLVKGIPGRSYGLSIARRLQLPESVIARAEERVPTVERDLNALLQALEARDGAMAVREQELAASTEAAQERSRRLAEREARLRERERAVERESRQEARRHVLDARQTVEQVLRDLKRAKDGNVEEAAREARRRLEHTATKQGDRLEQIAREEQNVQRRAAPRPETSPLGIGDTVEILPLEGRTARVVELRDDEVVVALGAMKMSYRRSALRHTEARPVEPVATVTGDVPDIIAASEVDVRGMRADEMEEPVLQAIDAAVRADLHSLRIIHGKGTGVLRERVAEMLQKDTRVRTFRLGLWNEGGAGVTIVDL
ncbi:MAG: endonuclease MutS2 [Gemmatimonadaceae bacterium]|nr:endonuclease MutS2 [Gemmatimonadaceae bacterium]